jgi:hypothetical protein
MRHGNIGLILIASALALGVAQAQAGQRKYPPRYQVSSNYKHMTVVRDGQLTSRYVYRGYERNLPPPSFLYYGYPHSGDDGGGFNGVTRWSP